jgi:hypothetical protein
MNMQTKDGTKRRKKGKEKNQLRERYNDVASRVRFKTNSLILRKNKH